MAPARNHKTHQERCVFSMMYSSFILGGQPPSRGLARRRRCALVLQAPSFARSAGVLSLGERVAAQLLHAPPQRRLLRARQRRPRQAVMLPPLSPVEVEPAAAQRRPPGEAVLVRQPQDGVGPLGRGAQVALLLLVEVRHGRSQAGRVHPPGVHAEEPRAGAGCGPRSGGGHGLREVHLHPLGQGVDHHGVVAEAPAVEVVGPRLDGVHAAARHVDDAASGAVAGPNKSR
mmetsp:Transcript_1622/g.2554  ORF Transcript_1622/g.2554 Transcript_1622/m.2554 type:complete len:230 (-) Transcript_1622:524-1213(-)